MNGQHFISSNININIDGTIVHYQWDGSNEILYVKGPTTFDILIMVKKLFKKC